MNLYEVAEDLVDWIPDTSWDTVLVMLVLYGVVLVGVMEFNFWLDRRRQASS